MCFLCVIVYTRPFSGIWRPFFGFFAKNQRKQGEKAWLRLVKSAFFSPKRSFLGTICTPKKTLTFQPFRCVFFAVGSLLVPNPRALLICQRCRIRLLLTCSPLFCPRLNVFFSAPSLLGATPDPKYRGEITLSGGPLFGSRFRKIEGLKTAFFFARGQVPTRRRVAACSVFPVTTCFYSLSTLTAALLRRTSE